MVHAQSNVTLYGIVDTGLVKESGSDVGMGSNVDSRIGFRGVEDLGSGMKATFELERRFNLNDGTQHNTPVLSDDEPDEYDRSAWNYNDIVNKRSADWESASNVGLKSDT